MIDFTSSFGRAVKGYLENEYVIWLTTVDSNLTPQPRPVWFIWKEDSFLIFSQAKAYKVAHIKKNPKVALHFNTDETGDKHVIIFVGEASIDTDCPPAYQVSQYFEKYKQGISDLDMTPEAFSDEYSVAIRINPTEVRGWE
ncbi:MAG TPA: TIGR03667 family PPOX class F420-dependent oxidoreductase [Anaerolineales bacterium]|nr:TIGR03667 family PPOX class F420-dependent oxidoreductase [Anaerolineales bacterium]